MGPVPELAPHDDRKSLEVKQWFRDSLSTQLENPVTSPWEVLIITVAAIPIAVIYQRLTKL